MTIDVKGIVARLRLDAVQFAPGGSMVHRSYYERDVTEAAAALEAQAEEIDRLNKVMGGIVANIPMAYLQQNDTPGAAGPTGDLDVVTSMRQYAEARWRLIDEVNAARSVTGERDALKAENERLQVVIKDLELACEQLAAGRSDRAYHTMIEDGQSNALLRLDVARVASPCRPPPHTGSG